MDGVLVDAKEWHYEALNDSLTHHGFSLISRYDHETKYDGLSTHSKLVMLGKNNALILDNIDRIKKLKQDYTMSYLKNHLIAREEQIAMFMALKEKGYKICICSNSIRQTVDLAIEKMQIIQFLEFSLSNEDVVKPKPDAEIYNKAITKLNILPNECLIIEDNFNGIKAAKASGAFVMEVAKVEDVTLNNINLFIKKYETEN